MTVDIVIPTFNEEHSLERCVMALLDYLAEMPFDAHVTIADNASTDLTPLVADRLARELPDVSVVHASRKGRGLALKAAWGASAAHVLVYMDVDLSTNLNALLPLVAPLLSGHSDLSIGTRLSPTSRVLRGSQRELISRGYNLLLHGSLGTGFGDAQCGFKAIRAETAQWLLPLVHDDGWFFDTELLVLAERAGLRIYQVPVDWVDDADSRVDLWRTAVDDLKGIVRVGWNLARGRIPLAHSEPGDAARRTSLPTQVFRFLGVGIASTIAYALLFLLLRAHTDAPVANVVALVLTTILNTAANRVWTFGVRGRVRAVTHQAQGFLVLVAGLVVTTLALTLSYDAGLRGTAAELAVLTAANLLVTAGRFAAFRLWVFRVPARPAAPSYHRTPEPPRLRAQPVESGGSTTDLAHDQA